MKEIARTLSLLCFLTCFTVSPLLAEDIEKYPSKPITITTAYPAGGSSDLVCRAITPIASKYFSQPIICVAKPGGSGLVALQYLASSKPDGYTFHLGRPGEMSIAPSVEKMPFTMEKDFIPVAQVGLDPLILSVNAKAPWNTIEELIIAAKKEPGNINFGCASSTSVTRFTMEKFCHEANIKLTAVPFKGAAPAVIAVVGGHVPVLTSAVSEILPHVQSGNLRVLLSFGEKIVELPNVPTARGKGFDVNISSDATLYAPKGTPLPIVHKFEDLLKKVTEDKEFISIMKKMGSEAKFMSGDMFLKHWSEQLKWMGDLVPKIGLIKQ